jgi:PAS domain S-box-containing protein
MVESHVGQPAVFLDSLIPFRHMIALIPDAVMIHHQDQIAFANETCLRMLGITDPAGLSQVSLWDFIPPESRLLLEPFFQRVISSGQQEHPVAFPIHRRDQRQVSVAISASPLPQSDGSMAVLIVLRNRAGQRPLDGESPDDEIQVRTIIESAMDGIISIDEQQQIILFNPAAELIFGWKADQMMGQPISRLMPPQFASQHWQHVEQFGRELKPTRRMSVQRTVMALRASGEEFPIEASISHNRTGNQRIYTVILRDVTEAVKYREQIEQQSQMLDQVSDAVRIIDLDGTITYWNQGATRLFGWTAAEAVGLNANDLICQFDAEKLAEVLAATNEHHFWSGEVTMNTRSGKRVIVDHRRTAIRRHSGAIKGYLCVDIDLTIRKKQEQYSHRSQRLESIGTLASGIAHDLNNVLTPILMGANLLSSDRAPTNPQPLLNTMVASAQRGAALIQKLLSFAGGVRGDQAPVRISQIIRETRGLLEHTLLKSVEIQTKVAENGSVVLGDSTELVQILMNLSINACDAMPDGGVLTIEAESIVLNGNASQIHPHAEPGAYLLLSVSDTGMGMSHEVLDRIFTPFYTTKEIGKGTGLGLATVQGIVKSYGGFITVYSEVGRGSKFSIYLPAAPDLEAFASSASTTTIESGRGYCILLVDDEEAILSMSGSVLEAAGYRVLMASDGMSAISKYREYHHQVSAVLLDMMMPGLSGLQTMDALFEINPQIKIISCSGLRTVKRETEVMERGAAAFLSKPYTDSQLLETLTQTLTTHPR